MKKKVLSLLLVLLLSVSLMSACGQQAAETPAPAETPAATEAPKEEGGFSYVTPQEAVDASKTNEVHILDIRDWKNYVAGKVPNSEWNPIFPLEDTALEGQMEAYAKEKLSDGKKIYIVCNSGKRGAEKTTEILKNAGIDASLIFTVEGGAKALANIKDGLITNRVEEPIEWKYAKGADTLKGLEDGSVQVVDVRDDETYSKGHLKGSLQSALKEIESPEAQTNFYNLAVEKLDKTKPVHLLCYSGNKCAKTAISIMKDAGFDVNNVFIIENGAKDGDISGAFVTE